MQKEQSSDRTCASPRTDAAIQPTTPPAGRDDVAGFLDIVRLELPVCLPALPLFQPAFREVEPLGDPRLRQFNP